MEAEQNEKNVKFLKIKLRKKKRLIGVDQALHSIIGGSAPACIQANWRGCSVLVASIELARKKALNMSHRRVKPSSPPTLAR